MLTDLLRSQLIDPISVSLGIGSYGVHLYGGTFRDEKRDPPRNAQYRATCALHLQHIIANVTCHQRPRQAQGGPVFRHLTSNSVVAFTRFASHLKCDIFQLQLIPQSNPSILPAVLPPPITNLLGASLGMSTNVTDDGHVD